MVMNKPAASGAALHRRDAIVRIVREESVKSQEDLQRLLRSRGFAVTQPTLSRDLKDLAIAKTPSGYVVPWEGPQPGPSPAAEPATQRAAIEEKLDRVLREFVLSVERAGTLIVLKTPPAAAHPVARAIDHARLAGLAGTIAGDDTIFLAASSGRAASRLAERLLRPIHPSQAARHKRS